MFELVSTVAGLPFLRRFALTLGGLLAFAVLASLSAPYVVPVDWARAMSERALGRLLGHPVAITGEVRFTVLPELRLWAEGLSSRSDSDFRAERIALSLDTVTLIGGRIDVVEARIVGPVLTYDAARTGRADDAYKAAAVPPDMDWGWWEDMTVRNARISAGRVIYAGSAARRRIVASDINLRTAAPSTDGQTGSFSLEGEMTVNGVPANVDLQTGPLGRLVSGDRTPIELIITAAPGRLSFIGAIAKRQVFTANGHAVLTGSDATRIDAWLDGVFSGLALGVVEMAADIRASRFQTEFRNIDVRLGETTAQGALRFYDEGGRRRVEGRLFFDNIDARPLLQRFPSAYLPDDDGAAGSLEVGWKRLRTNGLVTGPGRAELKLGGPKVPLELVLETVRVLGGEGRGRIGWRTGEGMVSVDAKLQFERVRIGDFLRATGGYAPLNGKAGGSVEVFSIGRNWREFAGALRGHGTFNVVDGELLEADLPGLFSSGRGTSGAFEQVIGTFAIDRGILTGDDFLFKGAAFSLVGDGDIDLAESAIDVRLQSLSGEAAEGLKQVTPFRVEGPLQGFRIRVLPR